MYRFLIIFFLSVFLFSLASAQQIQQLTNNSYYDGDPDIYKDRIAWTAGYDNFPNPKRQAIFLCEKGIIKQITFDDGLNVEPKVGSHYVTWRRFLENSTATSPEKSEIWCYDGKTNRRISLNSTENYILQTAGKNIAWRGDNPNGESKIYVFNGIKTEILPIDFTNTQRGVNFFLSEEGILIYQNLTNGGGKILFYDFHNYHLIAENKNDTTVGSGRISGRTVLFTKRYPGEPQFTHHFFMYKNSQTTALPELDSIGSLSSRIHFDSTYIVWQDRRADYTNYKLNVWKEGKHYFLSKYPFDKTQSHPELSELRFAWHERINNKDHILYFDGNVIRNIVNPDIYNYRPVVSGNSVVWNGKRNNENSTEIFYFCNSKDTNCYPVKPLAEQTEAEKVEAFYNYQIRQIELKISGGLKSKYNIVLYDLRGRLIHEQTISPNIGLNKISIPVTELQQSIYILLINNLTKPENSFSQKFLITR